MTKVHCKSKSPHFHMVASKNKMEFVFCLGRKVCKCDKKGNKLLHKIEREIKKIFHKNCDMDIYINGKKMSS